MIRLRSGEVLKLCVILLEHDDKVMAHILYGHKLDGVNFVGYLHGRCLQNTAIVTYGRNESRH